MTSKACLCRPGRDGWSQEQARSLRDELETISAIKPSFAKPLPAGTEKGVRWSSRASSARSNTAVGPATDCFGRRPSRASGTTSLRMKSFWRRRRSDHGPSPRQIAMHPVNPSGENSLGRGGNHQAGIGRLLRRHRRLDLPHVAGRPLSLLRCPSGTAAKCFFAKHPWQGLDESVRRVDAGDKEPMLAIDDVTGLISLVQAGVVEIHPWGSATETLEQPDRLIFDLDPGENVPWESRH